MKAVRDWILLIGFVLVGACSGADYFGGFPGAASLSDLGFPSPDQSFAHVSCSLGNAGGNTSGSVVFRARTDPGPITEFYVERGQPAADRAGERTVAPEATGEATTVQVEPHRYVSVVPIEGGVEVIAILEEVPQDLDCEGTDESAEAK